MVKSHENNKTKSDYVLRYNGQPSEWVSFKSVTFADLRQLTAKAKFEAAKEAVQPNKTSTVMYVIDLVDLIEGKIPTPIQPTPLELPTTPELQQVWNMQFLAWAYHDSATANVKKLISKAFPKSWVTTHADDLRTCSAAEIWKMILERYETKTTDTVSTNFKAAIHFTVMHAKTVDQMYDAVNSKFLEANNSFKNFTDGIPGGPHQLLTDQCQAMMILSSLPDKDYNIIKVTPEMTMCPRVALKALKAYVGNQKPDWFTANGKAVRAAAGGVDLPGGSTPINQVTTRDSTPGGGNSAKRGNPNDRESGGRGGKIPRNAGRGTRDPTNIECFFCKEMGHFRDRSKDGSQEGCPQYAMWLAKLETLKGNNASDADITAAFVAARKTAQQGGKKANCNAIAVRSGIEVPHARYQRAQARAQVEYARTTTRLDNLHLEDNDDSDDHERCEMDEIARKFIKDKHEENIIEAMGDDPLIWCFPASPPLTSVPSDTEEGEEKEENDHPLPPTHDSTKSETAEKETRVSTTTELPIASPTNMVVSNKIDKDMTKDNNLTPWCIDSGAGRSICNTEEWLRWTTNTKRGHQLVFPNGEHATTFTEGLATLTFVNKNPVANSDIDIPDCLLAEGIVTNIIAESVLLTTLGFKLTVSDDGTKKTYRKGESVLTATVENGVYYADAIPCILERRKWQLNLLQVLTYDDIVHNMRKHHLRLGHASAALLAKLIASGRIDDIPHLDEKSAMKILSLNLECLPCIRNKTTRISYRGIVAERSKVRCHTLHMDTKGPFSIQGCFNAAYGYKHLLVVTDDATSMKWIYFLKELRDAPPKVIALIKYIGHQWSDTPVRRLRADGFKGFTEGRIEEFCIDNGIKQEFSHPYSQEENGAPERYNRTLMETTRTLLATANIADYLWPEAAAYANDMLNRRVTRRTAPLSPHEVFGLGTPNANSAHTFGSIGFCHVPVLTRYDKTLAPRMHKCKFLGYSQEYKGFKVYDQTSNRVRHTRDFRVHTNSENEMIRHAFGTHPNSTDSEMTYGAWPHVGTDPKITNPTDIEFGGAELGAKDDKMTKTADIILDKTTEPTKGILKRQGSVGVNNDSKRPKKAGLAHQSSKRIHYNPVVTSDDGVHTKLSPIADDNDNGDADSDDTVTARITRSKTAAERVHKTPLVIHTIDREAILRRYKTQLKSMEKARTNSRETPLVHNEETLVNAIIDYEGQTETKVSPRQLEPATYKEARASPQSELWQEAIRKEYDSLLKSETWTTTTLPPNRKALPCKWVFNIKYNSDGSVEKYKARLVIKGFKQVFGVDYDETFAPVARYESLKIVLAMATILDMEVHQMDVCTAFLNGELLEEIYMVEPEGHDTGPKNVCKLLKSLYGLKQAGRIWYQLLHAFLVKNGFTRCHKEYCIYIQKDNGATTIIVVYVDDLTIASTNIERVNLIKKTLSERFEMKDLGEIDYLLKIKIVRDRKIRQMTLSQTKYINDLIQRFDMTDATPVLTPQVPNEKLVAETEMTPVQVQAQGFKYPELVGALLHLCRGTRPDIANAVRTLSKFLLNHNITHWTAALRVLKYLKGTSTYGLVYDGSKDDKITYQLYSDASFANTDEQRKSVTGYCVMMAGGPVSTKTTKQGNVTVSTTEAELVACSEACRESEWIWFLLEELGFRQTEPITVHCDNTAVVAIAKNPGNHNGTKHIEIRHLYIRHLVDQGRANIKYCWTEDMIADILTKAISTRLFLKLRHMLGVKKIGGSGSVGNIEQTI